MNLGEILVLIIIAIGVFTIIRYVIFRRYFDENNTNSNNYSNSTYQNDYSRKSIVTDSNSVPKSNYQTSNYEKKNINPSLSAIQNKYKESLRAELESIDFSEVDIPDIDSFIEDSDPKIDKMVIETALNFCKEAKKGYSSLTKNNKIEDIPFSQEQFNKMLDTTTSEVLKEYVDLSKNVSHQDKKMMEVQKDYTNANNFRTTFSENEKKSIIHALILIIPHDKTEAEFQLLEKTSESIGVNMPNFIKNDFSKLDVTILPQTLNSMEENKKIWFVKIVHNYLLNLPYSNRSHESIQSIYSFAFGLFGEMGINMEKYNSITA